MKLLKKRFHPRRLMKDFSSGLVDIADFLKPLPRQLRILVKKMLDGEMEIEFVHLGLENLIREIDRSSNRIAFGLIISALIIGSSIVMNINIGPAFFGVPLIGIIGFVLLLALIYSYC